MTSTRVEQGSGRTTFSASKVNHVIREMLGTNLSKRGARDKWLAAVATRCVATRPDLAEAIISVLGQAPAGEDHLKGLSIGEIGICYEAILSLVDRDSRKNSGQFFTPDDAAEFMAGQSLTFKSGMWLDPCCGVGNLSWYLAKVQQNPAEFIRNHLTLVDLDETARRTAVAIIAADWAAAEDLEAVRLLDGRSQNRNFLSTAVLPQHDFVIMNPPYARAEPLPGYETAKCRDLFAFFLERVAIESRGFIAVTPASYTASPKFQPVREVLDREFSGGDVYIYDNVPDTLFRGYKFGSSNTSKTNFVRAAITVCNPEMTTWRMTPIIRWQSRNREVMIAQCSRLLTERRTGPHGEWAKISPGTGPVLDQLASQQVTIGELTTKQETEFSLDVPLTPRYYISATYRSLERGSKETLYFRSAEDRDRVALVLNSSVPYLWWRALDGGVTLPRRVLNSTPVPETVTVDEDLVSRLQRSEEVNVVTKLNAGKINENVKHPAELTDALNDHVLGSDHPDLSLLYTNNMFPLD